MLILLSSLSSHCSSVTQESTPIHTKYISRYQQRKVDWNDQKQKSCLRHRSLNAVTLWFLGLPWWLSGNKSACQWRRRGFNPWSRKIPWERKWQLTPIFLPGKSHGQRSLVGYSPWGCSLTQLSNWTTTLKKKRWLSLRYSIREYRMIVNVSVPDQRHPDKREKGKARVLIFPQNIF